MIYLSKGTLYENSAPNNINISHGLQSCRLIDIAAKLWLNGRFEFGTTKDVNEENVVAHFSTCGLSEYETDDNDISKYRIMTRCICCPVKNHRPRLTLSHIERRLLTWITKGGLRLSTAELIYLIENDIKPSKELLGKQNNHTLVETIYNPDNIYDNILEAQMESAKCRDDVVSSLLALLQKKYIILL